MAGLFIAKINTAEAARIDSSGRLLVGTFTAYSVTNSHPATITPRLQLGGDESGSSILLAHWSSGAFGTRLPSLALGRSAGATGVFTVVNNNDRLGEVSFHGADGTAFVRAAVIRAEVDGTPGANNMPGRLVFSTTAAGASSPTERVRITSTGNVGIGTTNPTANLHVQGDIYSVGVININNPAHLRMGNTIRHYAQQYSITQAGGVIYEIGRMTITGPSQNINITGEFIGGSSPSNVVNRFIINIRSNNPFNIKTFTFTDEYYSFSGFRNTIKLYHNTSTGLVVIGYMPNNTFQNAGWTIKVQERGDYNYFQQVSTLTTLDTTGLTEIAPTPGAEKIVLPNTSFAASVGIGTNAPLANTYLHVSKLGVEGFEFLPGDAANVNIIQHYNRSTSAYVGNVNRASYHAWEVGTTESLRVDTSGNVGIGTTSPDTKCNIQIASSGRAWTPFSTHAALFENSGDTLLEIVSGNSSIGSIRFGDTDTSGRGRIDYSHSSDSLQFQTNGSERARIDSSGRLLVGTSTAAPAGGELQCHTTNAFAGFYGNLANNTAPVVLTLGKSRGNNFTTIIQSGDGIGSLRFTATDGTGSLIRAAQINCDVDGTPGANNMPGRLLFATTAAGASIPAERVRITSTGNVGIGTTNPTTTLHAYGNITLGNKSNSSALFFENTKTSTVFSTFDAGLLGNDCFIDLNLNPLDNATSVVRFFRTTNTTNDVRVEVLRGDNTATTNHSLSGKADALFCRVGGNVGIGTNSTIQKLHVQGNSYISGDVGIGTTSPTDKLHVQDGNIRISGGNLKFDNDQGIYHFNTAGTLYRTFHLGSDNNTYINRNSLANSVQIATNDTPRIHVLSTGEVGIATTSPSSLLEVLLGGSGEAKFSRSSGSQYASISSTAAANIFNSFSSSSNAKSLLINSTTNSSNTTPTSGSVGINLRVLSTDVMLVRSTLVFPGGNGTIDLGSSTARWKDIYATNTTIQTSDRNLKEDIQDCDLGLNFINQLSPVSFKRIDGTSGRKHYGLIAQDVEEVLNGSDAAFLIKSPVIEEKTVQITNPETGELEDSIQTADTGEIVYGLRYGELIAPMIKAIQELTEENKSLLARIQALENS
jgi:hypothetical protein